MSDLMELVERVKAATGPDRELDGDVFFQCDSEFPDFAVRMSALPDPATFATGAYTSVKAPTYTASIDASLALVERKLPGWIWMLDKNESGPFDFVLWAETGLRAKANAMGPTAPLAILAALLSALTSGASS